MLLFSKENTPKKVIRDTCPSITYYFAKYHRILIWLLILMCLFLISLDTFLIHKLFL